MDPSSADYQFERMIAQVPSEITATFTNTQLKALRNACSHLTWKKHGVDIRLSIPFPGRGYYLVFLAGKERRFRARQPFRSKYAYSIIISIIASSVLGSATLVIGFAPTLIAALKSFSHKDGHPTAIPWIQSQSECLETSRVWENNTCWDQEHDPNF